MADNRKYYYFKLGQFMSIRTLYWSGRRSMSISKPRLPGIGRCLLKWRPTA